MSSDYVGRRTGDGLLLQTLARMEGKIDQVTTDVVLLKVKLSEVHGERTAERRMIVTAAGVLGTIGGAVMSFVTGFVGHKLGWW